MIVQELRSKRSLQIPAVFITVVMMLILPFFIHLIGGPTAGMRWLPMFYAPFVAVVLFHPMVSIVAGLSAPFLNHLITGAPPLPNVAMLSFELIMFSILSFQLYRRWPAFWGATPLAYLLAKVLSLLLVTFLPVPVVPVTLWQFFNTSLLNAWPGLLVLLLINWLLVRGVQRAS